MSFRPSVRRGVVSALLATALTVGGLTRAEAADRPLVDAAQRAEWGAVRGRGSCPRARPAEPSYAAEATLSLCRNLAGVSGRDPALCRACHDPASLSRPRAAAHSAAARTRTRGTPPLGPAVEY